MFESMVTAPVRAMALPSSTTPVVRVTDARAMMDPANVDVVPSVADVPTCQKMLHCCVPLTRTMLDPVDVVSVEPI